MMPNHTVLSSAENAFHRRGTLIFYPLDTSMGLMGIQRPIARIVPILFILMLANPLFPAPIEIVEEQIQVRLNEPTPLPQLEILSTPSDAWVYGEGSLLGSTPLVLKDLRPSFYGLRVQKAGYRPQELSVTLKAGIRTRIQLELEPVYGTLSLQNVPPDCKVYIGGTPVTGKSVTLPAGRHRVVVQRFGFEDVVSQLTILEGKTTEIPLTWKRVPLEVARLKVTPRRINPENPNVPARISFRISGPAEMNLVIQNLEGEGVFEKTLPQPQGPLQEVDWDGKDRKGIPLPDGRYRLILQFRNTDTSLELVEEVRIDRTVRNPIGTTYSGLPGLLFSPATHFLDPGAFRIISLLLGLVHPLRPEASDALLHAGVSFPLADGLELTPTLSSFMEASDEPPDWIGGIGIQYRLPDLIPGILSFALTGKGSYMSKPRAYGFSPQGGLSLGAAMEVRHRFLAFLLSPELTLSPFELETLKDRMNLYANLRGGCYLDVGALQVGISTTLSAGIPNFRLIPIYHTGIEIHGKLPTLPFTLSLTTVFIQPAEGNLLVYTGGGIGALY